MLWRSFEKQRHNKLYPNNHNTFPQNQVENIILSGIFSDPKGANNGSNCVWGKKRKNTGRANQKNFIMWEPDVSEFVCPADHEAETQWTYEISDKEEVEVYFYE